MRSLPPFDRTPPPPTRDINFVTFVRDAAARLRKELHIDGGSYTPAPLWVPLAFQKQPPSLARCFCCRRGGPLASWVKSSRAGRALCQG